MFIRVFYSTRCNECMNLWQVIYNEGLNKLFIPVCLDNFKAEDLSKLKIKEIPAIVISEEGRPASIFEGPSYCSQWLTSFTINRRKNLAMQVEERRRLIQKAQAIARNQDGGPIEYTEAEMDGVSDNYAYTSTDLCQPKSFVMVGHEDNCTIITPIVNGQSKVTADAMKRELAELDASRSRDTQDFMNMMERNQISAIVNYNNN